MYGMRVYTGKRMHACRYKEEENEEKQPPANHSLEGSYKLIKSLALGFLAINHSVKSLGF